MTKYHVYFERMVSTSILVEAESPETAVEIASECLPSVGNEVDEAGEWEARLITTDFGHKIWEERVRVAELHEYYQRRQEVLIARLAAVRDLARVDRKTVRMVDLRAALAVKAEFSDQEG